VKKALTHYSAVQACLQWANPRNPHCELLWVVFVNCDGTILAT